MAAEERIDHGPRGESAPRASPVAHGAPHLAYAQRTRAVAALAAEQHGVVARRQLLALGVSRRAIDHQLHLGRLSAVHRGVYAVGHGRVSMLGRWMAGVLASGPEAVLSHRSAGMLWGIVPRRARGVEVIHPRRRDARPGLVGHRALVALDERTTLDSIPVTTPARTLLDLAAVLTASELDRAVHEAERLRLGDVVGLEALLSRHPGRRGTVALRTIVAGARLGVDVIRQQLEASFRAAIAEHDLPRPMLNATIEGFEVDAAWPNARVAVELDGHAVHATRRSFEADRLRDRRLVVAGWRVVRVTWRQLEREPERLLGDLRRLVAPVD